MKAHSLLPLAAIASHALAQDVFETANFNVTKALIANGIDVSALPGLANPTEERSPLNPCTVAVSIGIGF